MHHRTERRDIFYINFLVSVIFLALRTSKTRSMKSFLIVSLSPPRLRRVEKRFGNLSRCASSPCYVIDLFLDERWECVISMIVDFGSACSTLPSQHWQCCEAEVLVMPITLVNTLIPFVHKPCFILLAFR